MSGDVCRLPYPTSLVIIADVCPMSRVEDSSADDAVVMLDAVEKECARGENRSVISRANLRCVMTAIDVSDELSVMD